MSINASDACVLWHEEIAGRDGKDVASAILAFIRSQPSNIRHIRIWADNCAPQNKNWILYAALMTIVWSGEGPDSVTLRYLERGHTFMRADSIHGAIGRKLRGEHEVLDFTELANLISRSMAELQIKELKPADFLPLSNFKRGPASHFPKLRLLKEVHFEKHSKCFFSKFSLDAPSYFKRPILQRDIPPLPQSLNQRRGITVQKREEICRVLVPLMPEERRAFWTALEGSAVADLCSILHDK